MNNNLTPYQYVILRMLYSKMLCSPKLKYTTGEIVRMFKEGWKVEPPILKNKIIICRFSSSYNVINKNCKQLFMLGYIKHYIEGKKIYWYVEEEEKKRSEEYKTLEMDLIDVYKKRNIEVEKVTVTEGATKYLIEVKR